MSGFAQSFDPKIDDMALIWIGDRHRPDWNKELLTPYLIHTFADGHKTWFFDGFLMIDGALRDENGENAVTFGEAPGTMASPEQWEQLCDRQMGLDKHLGCKALDEAIEDLIPILGEPSYKHQVVMTVPIPRLGINQWGKINGKMIDFSTLEGRAEAQRWYIDLVIDKWEKANFKNIELAGFYWLRESITDHEVSMAKEFNKYVKSIGYESYWIPWFRAPHSEDWSEIGFTTMYIQPNYVFTTDVPLERLDFACNDSWEWGCGLEMEFEGFCVTGFDGVTDTRQTVPQWNCGMWSYSQVFYQRFVDYVDKFEEYDIFEFMPLSYYNGYQGIYDFSMSTDPHDIELMDRLASFLEARHSWSGWCSPVGAGINEIENQQPGSIYGVEGGIYVSDKVRGAVKVYSADGRLVFSGSASDDSADFRYGKTISCPAGIYIVQAGSRSLKVCVK